LFEFNGQTTKYNANVVLAYATVPMITTQAQILQPKFVVDETKMANVSVVASSNDAVVVPCATNVVHAVSMIDASNVVSQLFVLHANVTQPENVVPQAPVQTGSAGTDPKIAPNLGNVEAIILPSVEPKCDVTESQKVAISAPEVMPNRSPEQLQVVPTQLVPTVIVRPPTAPKGYSGLTSYKAYKEYFECLSICNGWTLPLIKAQNLVINLEGAASEAVCGLEVKDDSDYDKIWDMLKRRFSFQDDVERSRREFDRKRQEDNESVAQFELGLRLLYREAWPNSDVKSADAKLALQCHFVNGLRDQSLQQ